MIVKTFRAPTVEEALAKVKATLGDSALILDTRTVRPQGAFGFLRKPEVEVVVGIDDEPARPRQAAAPMVPEVPGFPWTQESATLRTLEREIGEIRDVLRQQARTGRDGVDGPAAEVKARLLELGADEATANELADECAAAAGPDGALAACLHAGIARRFRTAEAAAPNGDGPRVVALVGPPGVGKTTTLVKLARRFAIERGEDVALASVDFFRVGAVEQLKAYAEILGLPFHPAVEPDDAARVLESAASAQWLLVDTPGLAHPDAERLGQLAGRLAAFPGAERHLLLSAAADRPAALATVAAYQAVGVGRLLFTKLDEAPRRGGLLAAARAADVPVSYLADGQDVAAHLEAAEPGRLADLILE